MKTSWLNLTLTLIMLTASSQALAQSDNDVAPLDLSIPEKTEVAPAPGDSAPQTPPATSTEATPDAKAEPKSAEPEKAMPVIVKSKNGEVIEPAKLAAAKKPAKVIPWTVEWKSSDGRTGKQKADLVVRKSNDRLLLFMSTASPVKNLEKTEEKSGDDWVPLEIQSSKTGTLIYLDMSIAQTRLQVKGSEAVEYEFSVVEHDPVLTLTKGCKKLGLKSIVESTKPTHFPGLLTCKVNSKNVGEVTFSSFGDAEWFGAGIFEAEGKGERWKSYLYKDIITLDKFRISWGSSDNPTVARVAVPKAVIPPASAPKPEFTFFIGLEYLSGTITNGSASTSISGVVIPLAVRYQPKDWRLFAGASFDLFAYAMSNQATSSALEAHIGYQIGGKSFYIDPQVGYFNRFQNAPSIQTSSTFQAPQFGTDIVYQSGTKRFGLSGYDAVSSSGGSYSELQLGAFVEGELLFKRQTRFFVGDTQVTATSSGTSLNTSFFTLGVGVQF